MIGFPTFDIDAIIASNGLWQALTGASIVLSGLSVLALIIAQLHKIITFLETHTGMISDFFIPAPSVSKPVEPEQLAPAPRQIPFEIFSDSIVQHKREVQNRFVPLTECFGEFFRLKDLYTQFKVNEIPHPHLTIKALREAKILITQDNEQFSWNL